MIIFYNPGLLSEFTHLFWGGKPPECYQHSIIFGGSVSSDKQLTIRFGNERIKYDDTTYKAILEPFKKI
jgi:hypothetical protein